MDLFDRCKSFIFSYRTNLILWGVLLLIIIISNFCVYFILVDKVESININNDTYSEEKVKKEVIVEVKEVYKVDIKGAVKNPGVYQLDKGNRVIDVIKMAGGLIENADTRVNNLSKYITDEMVIVIYTADEVSRFNELKEKEKIEEQQCQIYNEVVINDSCKDSYLYSNEIKDNSTSEIDTKISINTASLELLMTLPGIGETKAKNIISYREQEGKFEKIEDIMNISGIGESIFEKIKDYITI